MDINVIRERKLMILFDRFLAECLRRLDPLIPVFIVLFLFHSLFYEAKSNHHQNCIYILLFSLCIYKWQLNYLIL